MQIDTIAAVSTAPGLGAIAVVRVSGPRAHAVLLGVAPQLGEAPEARRATLVDLHDPDTGELLDRALATLYSAPASYTGEDLVEVSCHGGALVPELVLDACLRAGSRRAEPGEFTKRAYLRGKMDLLQVEAIADVIEARSRALHRAALVQLERGLSARVSAVRESLVSLEAALAHHVDFPEEDDAPVPVEDIAIRAGAIAASLRALLRTAPEGELLREGAVTVLAGRPNVGKSSLYNALTGEERAIVTDIPGTTRDALEAGVQLGGFPFRLVDTAGLREPGERVERIGIEVTRRYLDRADLVLLCVSAADGVSEEELSFLETLGDVPVVVVETKGDLAGDERPRGLLEPERVADKVRVSVVTGEGLDRLATVLPQLVYSGLVAASPEVPVLTRRRHAVGVEAAATEVEEFQRGLLGGLPPEVAGAHLRSAETSLEEILGVISTEDVLDALFAEFCVGK